MIFFQKKPQLLNVLQKDYLNSYKQKKYTLMKYILLLLSLVFTTHLSMAQGNRQTPKTTVPTKPSTEAKPKVKPANADLTIADFVLR